MRGARTGSVLLTLGAAAALFWPLPQPEDKQQSQPTAQAKVSERETADKPAPQRRQPKADAPRKAAAASVTLPPPPPPAPSPDADRKQGASPKSPETASAPTSDPSKTANAEPAETAAKETPAPEPARSATKTPAPEPDKPTHIKALDPETDTSEPKSQPKVVKALRPTPEPDPEPARTPKDKGEGDEKPSKRTRTAEASPAQAAPDPAAKTKPQADKGNARPAPDAATSADAGGRTIHVDAANRDANARGATLLRLMEHGSGPGIEIAWPDGADARARLYDRLAGCLGMTTVVLGGDKKLYRANGPAGEPWVPNRDRYSGFMRQPQGYLAPGERRKADRIRARHDLKSGAPAVRLFPRTVDAALLSGLRRALGTRYESADRIVGRYRLDGGRVGVVDIAADGEPVAGRIVLGGDCGGTGL